MKPSGRGQLQLSEHLLPTAQQALVLDVLKTGTLLSLLQLCNYDFMAIFTRYNFKIIKNNKVIITGKRKPNGLWSMQLLPLVHQANAILWSDKTSTELANCYHASLGSPAKSTLLWCLGHLITFPGLMTKLISRHLTPSIATAHGHQDQEKSIYGLHKNLLLQNQQSTMPNMTWLQLMKPVQTSYVLCSYLQSLLGLILTKQKNILYNQAGESVIFSSYIIMTQTLSMQHPFLTGKLQPFALHGNLSTKH